MGFATNSSKDVVLSGWQTNQTNHGAGALESGKHCPGSNVHLVNENVEICQHPFIHAT